MDEQVTGEIGILIDIAVELHLPEGVTSTS